MKKKYADMDPLEEIRAIREEIGREFKSALALGEYLRNKPSADSRKAAEKRIHRPSPKAGGRSPSPRRDRTAKA